MQEFISSFSPCNFFWHSATRWSSISNSISVLCNLKFTQAYNNPILLVGEWVGGRQLQMGLRKSEMGGGLYPLSHHQHHIWNELAKLRRCMSRGKVWPQLTCTVLSQSVSTLRSPIYYLKYLVANQIPAVWKQVNWLNSDQVLIITLFATKY